MCNDLWLEIEIVREQDPCNEKVVKRYNEEYENVFAWVVDIHDHKEYPVEVLILFAVEVVELYEWVSLAFFQERSVEFDSLLEFDLYMIGLNAKGKRVNDSTWSWLNGISRE